MPDVLVTGFEPFGGADVNPSQLLVEALDLPHAVLPVSYARAAAALRDAIAEHEPDVVICFGQAETRTEITLERFAHNLDEADTTDNEALPGSGATIDPDGPLAYAASLPVDEIVAALRAEEIPAAPSRDAGGFLCNHVFYVLMRELEGRGAIGGFVHVPLLSEIPLDTLTRAARIIVTTCVQLRSAS